jgi:oligopeptide/dipeptide ABC transporter ATP-binding protein
VNLLRPQRGRVLWRGADLAQLSSAAMRALRCQLQVIFQDPLSSLDPRLTAGESVAEGLEVHAPTLSGVQRHSAAVAALGRVGLGAEFAARYPHELSGGQCQRVGIARAMVLEPRLLVCDEPLSALDAPTQQQVVALLRGLRRESGLALLFVSHNLAVVEQLCDEVLVLYLGRRMEAGPVTGVHAHPRHPYTRELLAAIPVSDPALQPQRLTGVRAGEPASPLDPPSGCVYRTRCPHAIERCARAIPAWEEVAPGHHVACHRWRELPPAAADGTRSS